MATATGKKMNKTAFVTEFLRGNPQANAKPSKTRKKRRTKKAAAKADGHPRAQANGKHLALPAERKNRSSDRDRLLEEVEGDIDRLIFKLMVIGRMEEIEDALRRVRRMLYLG